jgi:hypothetical protein
MSSYWQFWNHVCSSSDPRKLTENSVLHTQRNTSSASATSAPASHFQSRRRLRRIFLEGLLSNSDIAQLSGKKRKPAQHKPRKDISTYEDDNRRGGFKQLDDSIGDTFVSLVLDQYS